MSKLFPRLRAPSKPSAATARAPELRDPAWLVRSSGWAAVTAVGPDTARSPRG